MPTPITKPKLVPGTNVEYVKRSGLTDYLVEDWHHDLAALGYRMRMLERYGRRHPDTTDDGHTWITATPAPKGSEPVTVEDRYGRRTYESPAIAACYEAEIARVNAQCDREERRANKRLRKAA